MKDVETMLLEEGLEVLYKKLGVVKATQFVHLLSLGSGDSVKEIEAKTEKMNKAQALSFLSKIRKRNAKILGKTV